MAVAGFVIKIHNSLTTPMLTAGVPRQFFILNATLCAAIVLGMQSWYGIPIFIILHTAAVLMTKKDPQFFQVMVRHVKQKNYYGV
ncbi:VirB3 family type IV secretion system protein [Fangia hongkongensis]|uniref:VirB3 family type IV secretion system protein n=1 Tax=Fangia hongkongensis TaxID=270495 RepID=UPI0003616EF6|nr:VirB3 family type IV secretion system protein [Fangia hongkongensis]MBK2126112.1 VirB3 family type IV secretion system protein [Fangia hongkongensis]